MSRGEIDRAAFVTALQACGALRFGTFTLTSGKTSSYYIDIKRAVTRPELLRMIADAMAPYARSVDRKSTRLNSSHGYISYAVFCLKKKKHATRRRSDHRDQ